MIIFATRYSDYWHVIEYCFPKNWRTILFDSRFSFNNEDVTYLRA